MNAEVRKYNQAQKPEDRAICRLLAQQIDAGLPEAENKIWHAHPVWFLDGNPIAGYAKLKDCVRLLFWSGQSFREPGLRKEGSFRAAEARYSAAREVDVKQLQRWLAESRAIQWDYKNLVRRKGRLERLQPEGQGVSLRPLPDPTEALRRKAMSLPGVGKGASCNQSAFKAGKGSFLFLGPGARGSGFKAMFKLKASLTQARQLAAKHPDRFEVGTTGWVTARFTAETPLPERIWAKWLAESHALTCGADRAAGKAGRRP